MNKLKKCLIVFGTRPEAIKLAPVIAETKQYRNSLQTIICVVAQHREMLDHVLEIFDIQPDYDLNIMQHEQTLTEVTCRALKGIEEIMINERPDIILIQGDTTTAFAASLAAYYNKIPIGHIEAGLRSHDKHRPFPEEINRRITDIISDLYFAPTITARDNLLKESIPESRIFITGNTVIDALTDVAGRPYKFIDSKLAELKGRVVLITTHRRESFGEGINSICKAIKILADYFPDVTFVYPVHPNPNIKNVVFPLLEGMSNIFLIEPLPYLPFVNLIKRCYLILTDSGGIQEEAASLNRPVLVLREKTERQEIIESGGAKIVGCNKESIVNETVKVLKDKTLYEKMTSVPNPFGDGKSSKRIVGLIMKWLSGEM